MPAPPRHHDHLAVAKVWLAVLGAMVIVVGIWFVQLQKSISRVGADPLPGIVSQELRSAGADIHRVARQMPSPAALEVKAKTQFIRDAAIHNLSEQLKSHPIP